MSDLKKIKSALISVYNKNRVDQIVEKLKKYDVKIYSTGGTQKYIEELGVKVTAVEDLTNYLYFRGEVESCIKDFWWILGRREIMMI
jgi:phosphoribosylaminoimidazolecarboxamide formyltransferase/IMP cyclohydrolase